MLGTTDVIAFVPTTDSAKARAFYEGVLGLQFISDDGFHSCSARTRSCSE
jgi:catechol 2,3-dioxygenase-like lactoylglutathione lyase family enzyme